MKHECQFQQEMQNILLCFLVIYIYMHLRVLFPERMQCKISKENDLVSEQQHESAVLEAKVDIYDAIHGPPTKWLLILILLKVLFFFFLHKYDCSVVPVVGGLNLSKREDLIFEQFIIPEGYADF